MSKCIKHIGFDIIFLCSDCDNVECCALCVTDKECHRGHNIEYIDLKKTKNEHSNQQLTITTTTTTTDTLTSSSTPMSSPQSILKKTPVSKLKFSTNGPILQNQRNTSYYYLEPEQSKLLYQRIKKHEFTCLFGPRSTGKTTTALRVIEMINNIKNHFAIFFSIEGYEGRKQTIDFWRFFTNKICNELRSNGRYENIPSEEKISTLNWGQIKDLILTKSSSCLFGTKSIHLIIDEFDSIYNLPSDIITDILSEIRSWKSDSNISIKSVTGIGTFSILELVTNAKISPFNLLNSGVARNFSNTEVNVLLGMFEKQNNIEIEQSIKDDIFSITNGHKGLVNIIGSILDEYIVGKSKFTINDWDGIINRSILQRLSTYKNVTRMINQVLNYGNDNIKDELFKSIFSNGNSFPNSKEAKFLANEGIYTPIEERGEINLLRFKFSSNLIKQISLYIIECSPPKQLIPLKNDHLDIENILKIAARQIPPNVIKYSIQNCTKKCIQKTSQLAKDDLVICEFVYTNQISLILTRWFESQRNVKGDGIMVSPNNNIILTKRRPDLVITSGTSETYSNKNSIIVIELVVTDTIEKIVEHIDRTDGYVVDLGANEGWVLHFSMAKYQNRSYEYPKVPAKYPKVGILNVYHDKDYRNLKFTCYPPSYLKPFK